MQGPYTSAVLIYDPRQLAGVDALVKNLPPGGVLVSLDAEADMMLKDRGIFFLSAREYRTSTTDIFLSAERVASSLEGADWSWFSYRGVRFAKLFVPTLQTYFVEALYWVDIFNNLLTKHAELKKITVLPPAQAVPAAGAFIVRRQIYAVADCAALVGSQRGVEVVVPQRPEKTPLRRAGAFNVARVLWNISLGVLNFFVHVLRPRASLQILVSDYWRHVAPVLPMLPGVGVIMYDRQEAFSAGLGNIFRYRMRFMSAGNFSARSRTAERTKTLSTIAEKWKQARSVLSGDMQFGAVSVLPLFAGVLDEIMGEAVPAQLEEIDRIYAMLATLRPAAVLLRATVSQQWHFPLLALIAKDLGIPSLELLHGMEYPGPGSIDKRHVAQFLGVYGRNTQQQMTAAGFKTEELPIIGSPRFDQYKADLSAQKKAARNNAADITIFCTVPDLFTGLTFDTYDIEEYFKNVAGAVRGILGVSVVLKMRPGPRREDFYRRAIAEAFSGIPHTIAQYEPLLQLFNQSDIAVSCQSTVTLEAMQCGVPLILYASTPVEQLMLEYNFAPFIAAGATTLCADGGSLAAELQTLAADPGERQARAKAADTFLEREFAFDGKASERTAALVRSFATKGAVD